MFRPQCNLLIGNYGLKFCTSLNVSSSWQKITDTATLTFPTKFQQNGQTIIAGSNNLFQRGNPVIIQAGYFPALNTIFTGFVSKVRPELPLTLECEDQTFILKQTNVTFSLLETTLKGMLQTALSQAISKATNPVILQALQSFTLKCLDCYLGSFRATRVSLAQILDELKKTYALTSFFTGTVLNVGFAYSNPKPATYSYIFERDIIDSKLDYVLSSDVRISVKGISIQPNNTKIEAVGGDPDGEQRTLVKYNVDKATLQGMCNREADKFRYSGFRGSFQTFMTDPVKHGDIIKLTSYLLPERNGSYYASAVEVLGGTEGYFNNITLGAKAIPGVLAF